MMTDKSTIAAIATPVGRGGIGIIRISGPKAIPIALSLFSKFPDRKESYADLRSHHLYHGYIPDPDRGRTVDEVLFTVMKAPRSYTREDVAEIQAHSGPAVLKRILELVLAKGARLAEPGEFTRRAFLNGRIDLTQAEAVIDIIRAGTGRALEAATAQMTGALKQRIEIIREALLGILTESAAAIDFPEDVGEEIRTDEISQNIRNNIRLPLEKLLQRYDEARVLREGLQLMIAGKPNVGKSSLMNRLLQKDRAIVTPVPGTTRDMIEENLVIRGIPIVLTDTAGLHETADPVEQIGIERSRERIQQADLILFMTDLGTPLADEDHEIFSAIRSRPVIWVMNKSDLEDSARHGNIPDSWEQMPRIVISALHEQGMDELKDRIAETVLKTSEESQTESSLIPNIRHKQSLEKSLNAVRTAEEGIKNGLPFELISIDIQEALDFLGEIIGLTVREDVLDRIFSNFCIGK